MAGYLFTHKNEVGLSAVCVCVDNIHVQSR